jgi:hypothetical protein
MDDDELETTMRHGLRELANDAPRGDGLWETTTGMIAIQADSPPPETTTPEPEVAAEPEAPAPPSKSHVGLIIAIAVGILIALGAGIAIGLALRSSSPSHPHSTPRVTGNGEWPAKPIPLDDVVYNDSNTQAIVVADGKLQRLGAVNVNDQGHWRALGISPDRAHLYVTSSDTPCHELSDLDLTSGNLRTIIPDADVLALTPDASKAIITWSGPCAAAAQQPQGEIALRDGSSRTVTALPELHGAVNFAWSPQGDRVAAQPVGSHHVFVYGVDGKLLSQFMHSPVSQDALDWTSQGLILVDLGFDRSAVLRVYDPTTGQGGTVIARVPTVAWAFGAPLVTPTVTAIGKAGEQLFVEDQAGTAPPNGLRELREIGNGTVPIVVKSWTGRELVG